MKVLGIIPARYASSRFPGKPLADICGKSMVQRVYEQVVQASLDKVVVATDDERILNCVKGFGGEALLTMGRHPNGTSRCLEVVGQLEEKGDDYDIVVNIQGDEPFIQPVHIRQVLGLFGDEKTDIATLAHPITEQEELFNPNTVKVVSGSGKKALYFSRQVIPYVRDIPPEQWLQQMEFFKHIGLYAYRTPVLKKIVKLPSGRLENAEKLEQLRWLENGYAISIETTDYEGIGIDTPEDLKKLINKICNEHAQ